MKSLTIFGTRGHLSLDVDGFKLKSQVVDMDAEAECGAHTSIQSLSLWMRKQHRYFSNLGRKFKTPVRCITAIKTRRPVLASSELASARNRVLC